MSEPVLRKGAKLSCPNEECGCVYGTINKDKFWGEYLLESDVDWRLPYKAGEAMVCKECTEVWGIQGLVHTTEGWSA